MKTSLNWSEVSAVFGGTFDPPHLGHREAICGLFQNPGIQRVIIMPAGTPPLKPGATSAEHRLKMTELCFAGLQRFGEVRVDTRELNRAAQTGKPSYTLDTLLELGREFPRLAFVIGADQLPRLHLWHRFSELLRATHWIVLARKSAPGSGPSEQSEGQSDLARRTLLEWESSGLIRSAAGATGQEWAIPVGSSEKRLKFVQTPAPGISSSQIREQIARTSHSKSLKSELSSQLAPSVLAYLMEHRVYGMSGK